MCYVSHPDYDNMAKSFRSRTANSRQCREQIAQTQSTKIKGVDFLKAAGYLPGGFPQLDGVTVDPFRWGFLPMFSFFGHQLSFFLTHSHAFAHLISVCLSQPISLNSK